MTDRTTCTAVSYSLDKGKNSRLQIVDVYLEACEVFYKGIVGVVHEIKELVLLGVLVLVEETLHTVGDQARVVLDSKLLLPQSPIPLHVGGVSLQGLVLLGYVTFICTLASTEQTEYMMCIYRVKCQIELGKKPM